MSRDRLDLERKLLGMATPRALALLEIAALSAEGCAETALGHLYGVLELEPGLQALAADVYRVHRGHSQSFGSASIASRETAVQFPAVQINATFTTLLYG